MEMNKEQSEGSPADQQQWEVFLYVSGELSDDQELAFENGLRLTKNCASRLHP